jgi:hypothetical protein
MIFSLMITNVNSLKISTVVSGVIACRSRREGTRVSSILAARERQVTASSCIAHPSSGRRWRERNRSM